MYIYICIYVLIGDHTSFPSSALFPSPPYSRAPPIPGFTLYSTPSRPGTLCDGPASQGGGSGPHCVGDHLLLQARWTAQGPTAAAVYCEYGKCVYIYMYIYIFIYVFVCAYYVLLLLLLLSLLLSLLSTPSLLKPFTEHRRCWHFSATYSNCVYTSKITMASHSMCVVWSSILQYW